MVEQGTHKPLVGGSNPPSATNPRYWTSIVQKMRVAPLPQTVATSGPRGQTLAFRIRRPLVQPGMKSLSSPDKLPSRRRNILHDVRLTSILQDVALIRDRSAYRQHP